MAEHLESDNDPEIQKMRARWPDTEEGRQRRTISLLELIAVRLAEIIVYMPE